MKKEKKSKNRTLRRLAWELRRYRVSFGILCLLIILAKLCLAFAPKVSGSITDYLEQMVRTGISDTPHLLLMCGLLALLYLAGHGVDRLVNRRMVLYMESYGQEQRKKLQQKLNRLEFGYLDSQPHGELLAYMTKDIDVFTRSMESTAPTMLGQIFLLTVVFVLMFITEWRLTLIYVVALPISFKLTMTIAKRSRALMRKQQQTVSDLSSISDDVFHNHVIVQAFGCQGKKTEEYQKKGTEYFTTYSKSRFLSGFVMPVSVLTGSISFVALCIIGGYLMIHGQLTLGEFQSFIFFGNMVQGPLLTIASAFNNLQNGLSALDRVYRFLDVNEMPEEHPTATLEPSGVKGSVEFQHVKFGYDPERLLMTDVSFVTEPGTTMAIVGPSGAGKTTLINLLLRFYEINGGQIRLDGVDTAALSLDNLRRTFGMVLQDTWLLEGTIAENIGYGNPKASREQIIQAAKNARCDVFIEKLPDGYDTYLSQESSALSAGEKQLLTIARTILADPPILILDEATSQVDTKTEALITEAMEHLMQGRTCFVIAHRLYTIRNADQILVMKDGDIKEVGTHQELLALKGIYAEMYAKSE